MEKDLRDEGGKGDTPLWIFSVPTLKKDGKGPSAGEEDVGMGGLVLDSEGQRYMADRTSRVVKLCEFLSCFSFSWSYNYDCDVDDGDDDDDDDEGEMSTLHCVSFHHVASLLPSVSRSLLASRVKFKGITLNLDSRVFFLDSEYLDFTSHRLIPTTPSFPLHNPYLPKPLPRFPLPDDP